MTVSLSMLAGAGAQFLDDNGTPLAGGLIYTYLAGTTSDATTFMTSAGHAGGDNTNPIVLDAAGRVPYQIWLTDGVSYKFVVKTSGGTTVRTYDNLYGAQNGDLLGLLAASSGSSRVGFLQNASGAVENTVYGKLTSVKTLLDFIDPDEHAAILNGTSSYECASALQAYVDYVHGAGGGKINLPPGRININTGINCYPNSSVRLVFAGEGMDATKIRTVSNITVFLHAEYFELRDASILQEGTQKTGVAFATPSNKQAAYCRYERLNVRGFKFGIWWRYSLWCSVRDALFDGCACGIKASRNAFIDDQTNPAAPGAWNIDPGFFHNQNTFDNVILNGGEVGIFGTFNGAALLNVTCQGQSDSLGTGNVVLPVGQQGTGLYLQNGSGTSTFGAQANVIVNFYSEFTRQPIIFEYIQASILSVYYQGGSNLDKYPQAIKITGGIVNARGCNNTGSDWFDYRMVATDATIYGDPTAGTTAYPATSASAYNLTNTSWYKNSVDASANIVTSVTGANTISVIQTMAEKNTYSVEVVALYNGTSVESARFQVAFYNPSVAARIISDAGNSSTHLTCTVSGSTLNINTLQANSYVLSITAVQNRSLGAFL